MAKPVVIEIIARDGASKIIRPLAGDLRNLGDAGNDASQGVAKTNSGIGEMVTKIGLAGAAFGVLKTAAAGFTLGAGLDQNRRSLGTLLQDVDRGNKVFAEAIGFGQKYGYTQAEIGSSVAAAAGIIKNSTQTTEKSLEVLARLGSLNPAEGIEGATVAIKELASGDIVSLAERFNISKTEANAMKDAIAAGADPITVMDAALTKMGVSTQVLNDRMEGENGALLRNKLAFENAELGLGKLLTALGATYILEAFAAGLGTIADGLTFVATNTAAFINLTASMDAEIAAGTARIIERGASYTEYAQKMEGAGQSSQTLTAAQYALAQSLTASGMATVDAVNAATGLSDIEGQLEGSFQKSGAAAVMSADQQALLVAQTLELAAVTPQAAEGVRALSEEFALSGDIDAYATGLNDLELQTQLHAQAAAEDTAMIAENANMMALAESATITLTGSLWDMADAQIAAAQESINQAEAAEGAARFNEDLAWAVGMASDGAMDGASASWYLSSAYGVEIGVVRQLVADTLALQAARANRSGVSIGRSIGASLPQLAQKAPEYAPGGAYNRPKKERTGGGAGKSGGKSPAVKEAEREAKDLEKLQDKMVKEEEKFADKMQKVDAEHVAKEQAIWDDFYAKELAAAQKFNSDKFDQQLGFKQGLIDSDKDLWDRANAAEQAYWNKSQEIAQAGHGQQAEAYYQAGVELANTQAENAQEIRDAQEAIAAEEDAAEAARMQERLDRQIGINAQEEQLAADKLAKIEAGGDEIANERDAQLAEEETRYSDAQTTLKEEFGKAVNELVDGAGKLQGAVTNMRDEMLAAFSAIGDAASSAAAAASGSAGATGAEGGETAPATDGSHALGLRRVPWDGYIAKLHKKEEVLAADDPRNSNNTLQDTGGRSTGGGGRSSGPMTNITLAPNFGSSTAPRADVLAATRDLETLVRRVMAGEAKTTQGYDRMR